MLAESLEGRPVAEARRFTADDMLRPPGIPLVLTRLKWGCWRGAIRRARPAEVGAATIETSTHTATS